MHRECERNEGEEERCNGFPGGGMAASEATITRQEPAGKDGWHENSEEDELGRSAAQYDHRPSSTSESAASPASPRP